MKRLSAEQIGSIGLLHIASFDFLGNIPDCLQVSLQSIWNTEILECWNHDVDMVQIKHITVLAFLVAFSASASCFFSGSSLSDDDFFFLFFFLFFLLFFWFFPFLFPPLLPLPLTFFFFFGVELLSESSEALDAAQIFLLLHLFVLREHQKLLQSWQNMYKYNLILKSELTYMKKSILKSTFECAGSCNEIWDRDQGAQDDLESLPGDQVCRVCAEPQLQQLFRSQSELQAVFLSTTFWHHV